METTMTGNWADDAMAEAILALHAAPSTSEEADGYAIVGRAWPPCLACDSLDLDPAWILDELPPLCIRCGNLWGRSYDLEWPPEPAWFAAAPKLRLPTSWHWPVASVVRGQVSANTLGAEKRAWLRGWDIGRWCAETGGFANEHPDYRAMLVETRAGRFGRRCQEAAQAGAFVGGDSVPDGPAIAALLDRCAELGWSVAWLPRGVAMVGYGIGTAVGTTPDRRVSLGEAMHRAFVEVA